MSRPSDGPVVPTTRERLRARSAGFESRSPRSRSARRADSPPVPRQASPTPAASTSTTASTPRAGATLYNGTFTGVSNAGLGHTVMPNLTSGSWNTGLGTNALFANTSGSNNVATGAFALDSNTTGSNNVATGLERSRPIPPAANNIATGFRPLDVTPPANNNIAMGTELHSTGQHAPSARTTTTPDRIRRCFSNTTGDDNLASGYRALLINTTGHRQLRHRPTPWAPTRPASATWRPEPTRCRTPPGSRTSRPASALTANTTGQNNVAQAIGRSRQTRPASGNIATGWRAPAQHHRLQQHRHRRRTAAGEHDRRQQRRQRGPGAVGKQTGSDNLARGSRARPEYLRERTTSPPAPSAISCNTTGDANLAPVPRGAGFSAPPATPTSPSATHALARQREQRRQRRRRRRRPGQGPRPSQHRPRQRMREPTSAACARTTSRLATRAPAPTSATTRIGTQGTQTRAFMAGITGTSIPGPTQAVVVNSSGQLGTATAAKSAADLGQLMDTVERQQQTPLEHQQRQIERLREQGVIARALTRPRDYSSDIAQDAGASSNQTSLEGRSTPQRDASVSTIRRPKPPSRASRARCDLHRAYPSVADRPARQAARGHLDRHLDRPTAAMEDRVVDQLRDHHLQVAKGQGREGVGETLDLAPCFRAGTRHALQDDLEAGRTLAPRPRRRLRIHLFPFRGGSTTRGPGRAERPRYMGARKPFPEAGGQLTHSLHTRNGGRCHLSLGADRNGGLRCVRPGAVLDLSTVIALGLAYFIVIGLTHH